MARVIEFCERNGALYAQPSFDFYATTQRKDGFGVREEFRRIALNNRDRLFADSHLLTGKCSEITLDEREYHDDKTLRCHSFKYSARRMIQR
jgi:DNA repair protein RadC